MERCIQLARLGAGYVAPNPMVGCVIVVNERIIGEGWHHEFGKVHAEVNAIADVKDQSLLAKSTLYVSLEPCSHYGKTPPCVDLIIRHKIQRVVIGIADPFSKVNGDGIRQLEEAGIDVITPVLENQCRDLNKRFLTYHIRKRPYIILKWAQSKDGFIGKENERIKISNELSRMLVHKWRSEEQAIMIGTQTALNDNPQLNVREWFGKSPAKIVIDKELKIPTDYRIFEGEEQTLVFTAVNKQSTETTKFLQLVSKQFSVTELVKELFHQNILSVLIEGGAKLIQSFIEVGMWDEARIITGNIYLELGIKAPRLGVTSYKTENFEGDMIQYFKNPD